MSGMFLLKTHLIPLLKGRRRKRMLRDHHVSFLSCICEEVLEWYTRFSFLICLWEAGLEGWDEDDDFCFAFIFSF
jgi:hypothetical protein